MTYFKDPRLKILLLFTLILLLSGATYVIYTVLAQAPKKEDLSGTPQITTENARYDFGDISMSKGKVKQNFTIKNTGTRDLTISDITTSCMCTTALLEVDGKRGPSFGMPGHGSKPLFWSETIAPGSEGVLEVTFDPAAHGPSALGSVTRSITVMSDSGGKSNTPTSFMFTANVVR